MIEIVSKKMSEYYNGQRKRINHFMKVFAYSQMIGKLENLDERTQYILEITALMHDIGIKKSEEKYGSSAGHYQEIEGPQIAKKMLEELNLEQDIIERVCYIIGHHHTYDHIQGMDYQILVEADFLVNLDEGHCDQEAINHAKKNIFKTKAGIQFLKYMY